MVFGNILHNVRPLVKTYQANPNIKFTLIRTYAKWVSRRPVKILNEDELFECEDTTVEKEVPREKIVSSRRRGRKSRQAKQKEPEETENAMKKRQFTKLKENDKIVTSIMTNLKSRKRREKDKEIVLEGHRLIKDAMKVGLVPKLILFNDSTDLEELNLPEEVTLYKVPYKTIQLWSSLTTAPGLLGIFNTPDLQNNAAHDNNDAIPLTVICDNIREPGNLGSIMRAVAGVGCEKLIVMKGCVDLWDPKVLRSAAGTHFRLPIHSFPTWDEIPSLISDDSNIFVADSNFGDEYMPQYSPELIESSLNIFDVDPAELISKLTFGERTEELSITNKRMMKQFLLKLPVMPYYAMDYTRKESVIILSGETEGLNFDSCRFLNERKGIRINIPLAKGVDSLNAGVALGIVTFEIKRQFLRKQQTLNESLCK
ncbi:rRNA methyltransferase 3, mitochondrial [Ceratina calcarata]|uniref:rRNA methyltransferase 3, mitochondrial n=1 Tax=Ceratina calcarata TaxID=156304 RepID=A0AAJ7IRW1_9HYME|nr:rRNA methyltransferase 3, mitochondrial [Ceratina calcarata]